MLVVLLFVLACFGVDAQAPERAPNTVSYYELLGVSQAATPDEIKKGYRAMALKYHPDKIEDPTKREEAAETFMRISEANDWLSGDQRKRYDELLARGYLEYDQETYERVIEGRTRAETFEEMQARDTKTLIIGGVILVLCVVLPVAYTCWTERIKRIKAEKAFRSKINKSRNEAQAKQSKTKQPAGTVAPVEDEPVKPSEEQGDEEEDEEIDERANAETLASQKLRAYHKKVRTTLRQILRAQTVEKDEPKEKRKGRNKKAQQQQQSDDETDSLPQREWDAEEFNQALEGVDMSEVIAMTEAMCGAFGVSMPVSPSALDTEESPLGAFVKVEKPIQGGTTSEEYVKQEKEARQKQQSSEWVKKLLSLSSTNNKKKSNNNKSNNNDESKEKTAQRILQEVKQRLEHHLQNSAEEESKKEEEKEARLASQRLEQRKAAERAKKSEKKQLADWSQLELTVLIRAVAKFPGGVPRRWEIITRTVNTQGGNDRSEKSVIAKAKELEASGNNINNLIENNSNSNSSSSSSNNGSTTATTAADNSITVSSASTPTIATSAALCNASVSSTPSSTLSATTSASSVSLEEEDEKSATKSNTSSSSVDATVVSGDDWNADQQAAFEKALRTVDKQVADRWDQVTAQVPGKTKREVIQRYKDIQLLIKQRGPRKN